MPTATVTSKGQITIPKEIRAALELEDGDRVAFRLRDDGVVEMEAETVDVRSLAGVVKPRVRGVSVEDMERVIRERGGRQ